MRDKGLSRISIVAERVELGIGQGTDDVGENAEL